MDPLLQSKPVDQTTFLQSQVEYLKAQVTRLRTMNDEAHIMLQCLRRQFRDLELHTVGLQAAHDKLLAQVAEEQAPEEEEEEH